MMEESPPINSIRRIRQLVDTLKSEGVDPLFIYAALQWVAEEDGGPPEEEDGDQTNEVIIINSKI